MTKCFEKKILLGSLGKQTTLRIYEPAIQAIEKEWNSLYFPKNGDEEIFAEAINDMASVSIRTTGVVLISLPHGKTLHGNVDAQAIRDVIDCDKLKDCKVLRSNEFYIHDGSHERTYFERRPESLEDIEKILLWHLTERTIELRKEQILVPTIDGEGKKSLQEFVIRWNNMGNRQRCPICSDSHKPSIRKNIFMVGYMDPICHECQELYTPKMRDRAHAFYDALNR